MLGTSEFLEILANGWREKGKDTNAILTVAHAAVADKNHVVTKIDASYSSATVSGLLELKFGTEVVAHKHIHGAGALDMTDVYGALNPDKNEAVSAVLAAGGAGVVGAITISGYTLQPELAQAPGIRTNPADPNQ